MTSLGVRSSLVSSYSKLVGIILIIFGVLYLTYFKTVSIALVSSIFGLLALMVPPLTSKISEIFSILFLYACGLVVVLFSSSKTGGILSPIIFWVTTTPMLVGLVFRSSRFIVFSGIFAYIVAIGSVLLNQNTTLTQELMSVASLMALAGICTLNTLMTYIFHRELGREKVIVEKQIEQVKALESEVVQKEKMAMLGLLSSGVAHQLGNTLNTISSAVFNIEKAKDRSMLTPERLENSLVDMKKAITVSIDIIRGLDFASKSNVVTDKVKLFGVLETSVILMKGKILEGAKVVIDVDKAINVFASKNSLI